MNTLVNLLHYLKALASLVGAVATALLTVYTDEPILTVVSIVATVVATWAVPNDLPERLAGNGGALDHDPR